MSILTTQDLMRTANGRRALLASGAKITAPTPPKPLSHVTGVMNKTEARYADRLRTLMLAGEVVAFDFERVTLRLDTPSKGRAIRYTPDFPVWHHNGGFTLDEVKGGYVREDAMQKFRWACEQFPHFHFRMWQWKGRAWTLLRESKRTNGEEFGNAPR